MRTVDDGDLQTLVSSRYPELRRSAFLMCGDWSAADEVTQRALARVVADSRRGKVTDPDVYAWSELMDLLIQRPGKREHLYVAAPDSDGSDPDTVLLLAALHRLTPRCRAVLVLRRWVGLSVE